jgi:long-subunit acyl-CoA synthetase (AMP-forming)
MIQQYSRRYNRALIVRTKGNNINENNNNNIRAISKAQNVRKWAILDGDFSVNDGELTSTSQMRRREVQLKHMALIEQIYLDPRL